MNTYRYPNITGDTDTKQLQQLKSYLYQLVEQMNNAANQTQTQTGSVNFTVATAPAEKKTDPLESFAAIKGLIIKSADIVNAYCEKIEKKLSGVYVAQSEFGDYVRKTENALIATDTYTQQCFSHLEQIITDAQTREQETKAYIRTGLLFYAGKEDSLPEGTPVYGVEVGQENDGAFRCFGRFTAYGMTFYDENGTPAAQIAQGKLRIPQAVVELSFTLGGFHHEVLPDGSLVTRWQGV